MKNNGSEVETKVLELLKGERFDEAVNLVETGVVKVDSKFGTNPKWTLMDSLVAHRSTRLVRRLIELGADVNQRSMYGSLLADAAAGGDIELVDVLLTAGADINGRYFDIHDSELSVITTAARSGNVDLVSYLLKMGADPRHTSKRGITATHSPVEQGRYEMLKLLIAADCPIGGMDLHLPVVKRDREMVRFLLQNKAPVNGAWTYPSAPTGISRGDTPLHLIVAQSGCDIPVLHRPPRTSGEIARQDTILKFRADRLEILAALNRAGADVNAPRGKSGHTPLALALRDSDLEIARILLEGGASPATAIVLYGKSLTPRMLAEQSGKQDIVQLIAAHGG